VTIGNTAKIADLVASHQLDIGIVEGYCNDWELIEESFAEDLMIVVASPKHHLARQKNKVKMESLTNETWVVREQGSGTREATERLFQDFKITPTKFMYFSSIQSIKESVEAGLGISLLSQWAVQKELKNGDLKVIKVKGLSLSRKFSIITKS